MQPQSLNITALRKLIPNITSHSTDGTKYRRTVYDGEHGDLKITVYIYNHHFDKSKSYALILKQNSHIKDGTPEAKALLHKHGGLTTYQSGGDCYVDVENFDTDTPSVILETLQKHLVPKLEIQVVCYHCRKLLPKPEAFYLQGYDAYYCDECYVAIQEGKPIKLPNYRRGDA